MLGSQSSAAGATLRAQICFEDAIACRQRGELTSAESICKQLLEVQPHHADGWHLRGLLAFERGEHEHALEFIERSLALNPTQPAVHANRGCALLQLGRAAEAIGCFDHALALQPEVAMTFYGRATALMGLSCFADALADFDRALQLSPQLLPAARGRGRALWRLQRSTEALACLERVLQAVPGDFDALQLRGDIRFELFLHEEALADYERALRLRPESVELWNNRGNALRALARHQEALASFEKALALIPDVPEAWSNRGSVLLDLNRLREALACYDTALRLRADFPEALDNRGLALLMDDRPVEAAASYARLVEVAPQFKAARGNLLHARCLCCDWTGHEEDRAELLDRIADDELIQPFALLAVDDSAELQLRNARRFVAGQWAHSHAPLWNGERYGHERLRVAYVSADLRQHAVSYLMAGVFEQHDRERFETIAIALRAEDGTATGRRVRAAFAQFIDVSRRSDREVAQLLRELEVDVAVDLMGLTRGCRPGIFARRPAPVQVSYLGFPGTCGAPFIDYIIADDFIIPPEARGHYAEQVAYLPECFQANDDRCLVAAVPSRAAVGLPEQGLVFCCFNNSYKLNPRVFAIWMRLLKAAPDSVLWLLADRGGMRDNLLHAAAAHGVDGHRLVFAGSLPYADHLARLALADLFLDTVPFNAGTTASDALRCGLPVLTCAGRAFAARMAGSLLRAVGLPETVTFSLQDYERRALELAREPDRLVALRARLAHNLAASPLFDTQRFCRHLEAAYLRMNARVACGEAPATFKVMPLHSSCRPPLAAEPPDASTRTHA